MVSNFDTILDMSETFARVNEWWRYIVGSMFAFLSINIPDWLEDCCIILLLATSSANVWLYKERKTNILSLFLRSLTVEGNGYRDTDDYVYLFGDDYGFDKGISNGFGIILGISSALSFTILMFVHIPASHIYFISYFAILLIGVSAFIFVNLPPLANWDGIYRIILIFCAMTFLPVVPFIVLGVLISGAWKAVLKGAGSVVLLLALNTLFANYVEPFRGRLADLPRPPGAGPAAWEADSLSEAP